MKVSLRLSLVCAIVVAFADILSAAPITFEFSGLVFDNPFLNDFEGIGNQFEGRFTFDGDAIDLLDDPLTGIYQSPQASPYGYEIRSGSFFVPFVTDTIAEEVMDGSSFGCIKCDGVRWRRQTNTRGFYVSLISFTNLSFVNGDDIVTEPPDVTAPGVFPYFEYYEGFPGSPNYRNLQGRVTDISEVHPVPEPALMALLAVAVLAAVARRVT